MRHGFAIVNNVGGLWSEELFDTRKAAMDHLKSYWGDAFEPNLFSVEEALYKVQLLNPKKPLLPE